MSVLQLMDPHKSSSLDHILTLLSLAAVMMPLQSESYISVTLVITSVCPLASLIKTPVPLASMAYGNSAYCPAL